MWNRRGRGRIVMLFTGQKIVSCIDNKARSMSIKEIRNGKIICSNSLGETASVLPDNCRVGNNGIFPLTILNDQVGLIHKGAAIFTTDHAVERAVSRGIIQDRKHFVKLIHGILKRGVEVPEDSLGSITRSVKYGTGSKRIWDKNSGVTMVLIENRIVTIYYGNKG